MSCAHQAEPGRQRDEHQRRQPEGRERDEQQRDHERGDASSTQPTRVHDRAHGVRTAGEPAALHDVVVQLRPDLGQHLGDAGAQVRAAHRPVGGGDGVQQGSLVGAQRVVGEAALELPVGARVGGAVRQLADQQVAADGEVEHGGGHVDGVDRSSTSVPTWPGRMPSVTSNAEWPAPPGGRCRRRGGRVGHLGVAAENRRRSHSPTSPSAAMPGRRSPSGQRGQREGAVERPALHDLLVGRHRPGREAHRTTWTTSPAPRGPSWNVGVGTARACRRRTTRRRPGRRARRRRSRSS